MSLVIRDVLEHELQSVLELNNEAAGPVILPMDSSRLRHFHAEAEYFRVAEDDGRLLGFLAAFGSDVQHDSANFRWFREHLSGPFLYIDRIVVAGRRRGAGIGRAFYADVQTYAEMRYPQLACEVFLREGFNNALLFHGSFGFQEVGQRMQDTDTRAAMLVKSMCSHDWIQSTYGTQLPDVPWVGHPRTPVTPARASGTHA